MRVTAFAFARDFLAARQQFALAILVALFPSTALASVGSDGLSALAGALAFYLALRWYERPGAVSALLAGAAAAAAKS